MDEDVHLSEEAQRIMAIPFPERKDALYAASDEVQVEIALHVQRELNAKHPRMRWLTDKLTKRAIHG
jgi:hypothetical protein